MEITAQQPEVSDITKQVLYLGGFTVWYADVYRATHYAERAESDVEHSYMLTMVALCLADTFYPNLDQALIAQFSLVHDTPEAITGDVPTFNISQQERETKEAAEKVAVKQLLGELPTYWANLLQEYEKQEKPEARFVRLVDKVMPPLTNVVGDGARTTLETYGMTNREQLTDARRRRSIDLRESYPEFPAIHDIRDEIVGVMHSKLFDSVTGELIR